MTWIDYVMGFFVLYGSIGVLWILAISFNAYLYVQEKEQWPKKKGFFKCGGS